MIQRQQITTRRGPTASTLGIVLLILVPCASFAPPRSRPQSSHRQHRHRPLTFTQLQSSTGSNNDNTHDKTSPASLLNDLKKDLAILTELRPPKSTGLWPQHSVDQSLPLAIVSAGSSYTRIWTHQTWDQHSYPPHQRYLRHVRRWYLSTTARKILPSVAFACAWSILLSSLAKYYHLSSATGVWKTAVEWSSPTFSFLSAPLALLLTLRANASMARLLEARGAWGRLVSCQFTLHVHIITGGTRDMEICSRGPFNLIYILWNNNNCNRSWAHEHCRVSSKPTYFQSIPAEQFYQYVTWH